MIKRTFIVFDPQGHNYVEAPDAASAVRKVWLHGGFKSCLGVIDFALLRGRANVPNPSAPFVTIAGARLAQGGKKP